MTKKFLVLGSCRVVNTIAYELGDNIILNEKDLWFTHYPQEHIQKVKHLFGVRSIPLEHKELFVRYEQQNHYTSHSQLRVGDSIGGTGVELKIEGKIDTLNVIVELPTIRYIKVPIDNEVFWGHSTNIDLIRNSEFNQVGGHCTDEEFLKLLKEFEQVLLDLVLSHEVAGTINFVYVPHNPFIEIKEGCWKLSEQRTHIFDLICKHCRDNISVTGLPMTRRSLDVRSMIEEHGGVDIMLEDQNHYSIKGRKVAFKYLDELTC